VSSETYEKNRESSHASRKADPEGPGRFSLSALSGMGVNNRDGGTHKGPEHNTSTMLSSHPSKPVPITVMRDLSLRVIACSPNYSPAMKMAAGAEIHGH
jgi:hypothetical protein